VPKFPKLPSKDKEMSDSFDALREAARDAKKPAKGRANFTSEGTDPKDITAQTFLSPDYPNGINGTRRGRKKAKRFANSSLATFLAKQGVWRCLNVVAIVLFTILLVLTCMGIAVSLVAFEPINLELARFAHSDRSPEELRAYQNIVVEVLRYVTTLPFETTVAIDIDTEDLSVLRQWSFFENELCHLTDVRVLLGRVLLLTYVVGIFSLVVITLTRNTQFARHSLLAAGISCLALPFIGAVFIYFFFDPTFVLFHEIFFPQGNWSFPQDTLIISTFPGHYWQTAGLLWMAFFTIGGGILTALSRFCGKMYVQSVTND